MKYWDRSSFYGIANFLIIPKSHTCQMCFCNAWPHVSPLCTVPHLHLPGSPPPSNIIFTIIIILITFWDIICFWHLASSRVPIICFCNYDHCPCCQHKMKLCEWSPEYKGSPLSCLIALMSPMIYPLNLKCTKPSLIDWLPPGYWSVYMTNKLKAPFQVETLLQANEQASRPAEEREAGGWHRGRPGEGLWLREDRDEVRQHWHVPLDAGTQHRGLHIGEI